MMKARTFSLAMVALLALLVLALPTAGQTSGFVINNADATSYVAVAASPNLNTLISSVGPRFVADHANAMRYYGTLSQ